MSLPCAPSWDAGEGRSPQGGDAGVREPFPHTTAGNMVYSPVMEWGIKEQCGWQPEGAVQARLKYQCSGWRDLSNV